MEMQALSALPEDKNGWHNPTPAVYCDRNSSPYTSNRFIKKGPMPDYRRAKEAGGTYFFTVVSYRRQNILCEEGIRHALRDAIQNVRETDPFAIDAWVLLPDHLHCIWTLPPGDTHYSPRWARIKRFVSQKCGPGKDHTKWMNDSQRQRHESTIWQRRFWEHQIRDDRDLARHIDYIHYNPVKHHLVPRVIEWPWSTFHQYLREGIYTKDWGNSDSNSTTDDYGEPGA